MNDFKSNDEELLGFAPDITYHPPPAIRDGETLGEREQAAELPLVFIPTVQEIIYLKDAVKDTAGILDEQLNDIELSLAHFSINISELDLTDEDLTYLQGISSLTIQDLKNYYLTRTQPLSQTIVNTFQKGASDITGNIDAEIYADLFGIRNIELYVYANAVSGIITLLQSDLLSNTNDLDRYHSTQLPPGIADYVNVMRDGMDKLAIAISNYIALRKKAVVRQQIANMTTPILQSIKDSPKSISSFIQGISQLMGIITLANDIKRSSEPIGDSNIQRVVGTVGNLEIDPKMALGISFLGDKIKKPGASFLTDLLNLAPPNQDFNMMASQITSSARVVHQYQTEKMINMARLFALKNQLFDNRYDFLHDKDSKRLMHGALDSINTKLKGLKNKDFNMSNTVKDILSSFGNKLFGEQKRVFQSSPFPRLMD